MPRALLPVAVLLAVVLCAVSGFALAGLAFGHTEEHSRTVSGPVTRVVVDGAVRDVTIHERRRYGWRKPRLRVDLRGGVLHVHARCGSWSGGCADDLDIVVPHSVRTAAVASSSGDVALAGLTGDAFTATTDSGDVRAHRISGSLTLRSDSGDLEAGDVAGKVRAHTDSGDVRVRGS
jgi:Putative adhesin